MTASNLAVVFQPGLVSSRGGGQNALLGFPGFVDGRPPPSGSAGAPLGAEEQAGQHGRDKEVLAFLISHQTSFMLDLETPVDAERQKRKGVEVPRAARPEPSGAPPAAAAAAPAPSAAPAAAAAGVRVDEPPVASTSAIPLDEAAAGRGGAAGGATDLHRRGSEKSVERRRLRKSKDATEGAGKVKRSKTWGSATRRKRAEGREPSRAFSCLVPRSRPPLCSSRGLTPPTSQTASPNEASASNSPQAPIAPAFAPQKGHPPRADAPPTVLPPPVTDAPTLAHRPSVKKKARKSAAGSDKSPALAGAPLPAPPGLSPASAAAAVAAAPMVRAGSAGSNAPIQQGGGAASGALGVGGEGSKPRRRSMDPDGKR